VCGAILLYLGGCTYNMVSYSRRQVVWYIRRVRHQAKVHVATRSLRDIISRQRSAHDIQHQKPVKRHANLGRRLHRPSSFQQPFKIGDALLSTVRKHSGKERLWVTRPVADPAFLTGAMFTITLVLALVVPNRRLHPRRRADGR